MILPAAYRSLYTYRIPFDEHARATNYAQPVVTEQLHHTGSEYQGLRRVETTYDDFGMVLTSVEGMWSEAQQAYATQRSTTNTYTSTTWHGELLESELFKD
jgi:hypothetical protein